MHKLLSRFYSIYYYLVVCLGFVTCGYSQITFSTPSVGFTQACASSTFNTYNFSFAFFPVQNLLPGNQFIVELSDATGSFASPTTVKVLTNTTSPVASNFAFPVNTYGTAYRIRVRSTNPVKISPPSNPFPAYYAIHNIPFSVNNNVGAITLCEGETAALSIDNTGTPASPLYYPSLTYIWYKNYVEIPGQTGPTLTVSDVGSYYAVTNYGPCVMNSYSNMVQIQVQNTLYPTISTESGITTICPSDSVTLTCDLQDVNYTYRWFKNDIELPGTDNFEYQATEEGLYHVVVMGLGTCEFESNAIALDVTDFDLQLDPSPETALIPGETLTLTAITDAVAPVIKWYKDTILIPGATSLTLNVTQPGDYKVEVMEPGICNVTKEQTVSVEYPLGFVLAVQPAMPHLACVDTSVNLSISQFDATIPSGTVNLIGNTFGYAHQWYRNGVALTGATATSLTVSDPSLNGSYVLRITIPGYGVVISNAIVINLAIPPVTISGSTILCSGGNVPLTSNVFAAGYTYQWYKDNVAISGATTPSYTATTQGDYRLSVSSGTCTGQSNTIQIVPAAITLTSASPAVDLILPGQTKPLTVTTNANGPTYTWTRNGLPIAGTTATLNATQSGIYKVVVTQTVGCSVTAEHTFTLNYPTGITVFVAANTSYIPCVSTSIVINIADFSAQTPSGTVPMTDLGYSYQWFFNGSPIPGATSQSYTLTDPTQNGIYSLEVTIPDFATIVSNNTTINLALPAVTISGITILCSGGTAPLSSDVTSSSFTYQWYKDTMLIPGATSPTYAADAIGSYHLVVTSGPCTVQSNTIAITASSISVSSTNPAVDLILPGQTKPLTVTTDAVAPTYTWTRNGQPIAGTSATLNATQAGEYKVTVTQTVGCNTSAEHTFILDYPTGFTITTGTAPGYTACTSTSTVLNITSFTAQTPSGTVIMTDLGYAYQWYLDGIPVTGATSQTLNLNSATQNGVYSLEVTMPDFAGIISNNVTVNLAVEPITISGGTVLCAGGTLVLSANVSSTEYTYQWYKDSGIIPGATSNTYTADAAGAYYVSVSNGTCSAQSNTLTLTVTAITTTSTNPATELILPGQTKMLSVTTNANVPQYSWTRNGQPLAGTAPTFNATQAGEYKVTVTQTVGCNAIAEHTFTLEYPTGFTINVATNAGYTACTSTTAILNITNFTAQTPSGDVPMTNLGYAYQWYLNGSPVAGATTPTLTVTNASQNGNYSLSITMPDFAPVFSNIVAVNLAMPTVAISSAGVLCTGGTVVLSSTITNPAYTYQWYKNNIAIAGATASAYTADSVGDYHLIVTGGSCTSQSNTLQLTIAGITVSSTSPVLGVILPGETKTFTVTTNANMPQYSWTRNGQPLAETTSTLTATQSGVYKVTVTQTVGCNATAEYTFTLESPTGFTVVIAPSGYTACVSTATTLDITTFTAQTSAGTVPMTDLGYAYQWYLNGFPVAGATSSSLTLNSATENGSYSLSITMPGFAAIYSNNVTKSLAIGPVTVSSSNVLCLGGTSTLSSSVTDAAYTYQWYKNNGSIAGAVASTYTADSEGDYYVKVSNGGCETQSNTVQLIISAITVSSTSPAIDIILPGETKVITVTTNAAQPEFAWYRNGSLLAETSDTLTATQDGDYKVKVTQTAGCNATGERIFTLGYPTGFMITIAPDDMYVACTSASITLDISDFYAITANGNIPMTNLGYSYQWYRNGNPVAGATSPSLTINNAAQNGDYRLGVVMPGFSALMSNIITVNLSVGAITIVADGELCFNDPQVTISADITDPAFLYSWFKDNVQVSFGSDPTFVATEEGDYYVTINTGACVFASNVLTVVESDFTLTANSPLTDVIIQGDNKTISVTTDAVQPAYVWYRNDAIVPGANGSSLYTNLNGEYKVVVTQTQGCNIVKELIFNLIYPSGFDIEIAADPDFNQCEDLSTILNISLFNANTPSGPIDILGNSFGYQYQWLKDNTAIPGATGTTLNVTESGDYSLKTTIPFQGDEVSNVLTITLGFIDEVIIASDDFYCAEGASIEISANVNDPDYSYKWFKQGSNEIIGTESTITVTEPGAYILEVGHQNCTVVSNTLDIVPYDLSQVTISSGPVVDLPEGTVTIITAEGAETYTWYLGETVISETSSVEVSEGGNYKLVAKVGECEVIKEFSVKLVENKVIAIPNLITPNNDGINDQWALPVKYLNNPEIEIVIYGPDGSIVFKSANYMNNWPESGFTYSLKNPVYYYTIMEGLEIVKRGSITIVE